ncbi:hypothetical protein EDD29_4711 [Actinocorallia herbida]|uniref:Tachylectin n=1 Tax=Actinocorallia herbida TaxID=58109 RepID=A0A3N1D0T1_9ACTN|nr:hypothetical protein [Actinocorallia herbida]ROO87120.1 hypothetical protein EDD29_4711 [Actinocorallia herbida]
MKRKLVSALSLVIIAATPASVAAAPVWQVHLKTGEVWLGEVEVIGKGNTWFFGEDNGPYLESEDGEWVPAAYHWDGRTTRRIPLPEGLGSSFVDDADFAGPNDGWLVGTGEHLNLLVLHWDGKTWKVVRDRPTDGIGAEVKALGGGRALVTGFTKGRTEMTATFDGEVWREAKDTLSLHDFSGRHALSWESGKPGVRRWTGKRWTKVAVGALPKSTKARPVTLHGLQAVSAENIWVIAERATGQESAITYLLHWNGRSWKRERVPLPSPHAGLYLIAPDGRGGLWASGGTGYHYAGEDDPSDPLLYHRLPNGKWTKTKTDTVIDDLAAVPGTTSLWAVARHGYSRDHTILTHNKPR